MLHGLALKYACVGLTVHVWWSEIYTKSFMVCAIFQMISLHIGPTPPVGM